MNLGENLYDIIIEAGQSNAQGCGRGPVTEEYVPLIPFVSGDFVNEWKSENIESCAPIVEKIKKITASEGGIFVETSDLLSNNQATGNGDNIHFSRESLHILGIRYFDAFSKIIRKKRL